MKGFYYGVMGLMSICSHNYAFGDDPATHPKDKQTLALPSMEIVGTTALPGRGIAADKIPTPVQVVKADDLQKTQSLTLGDYMNRYLGSVNINDAQNNPYQPDVQFRGYTASHLLGLPQGLSVYVNGTRFNESFGDSVNWDLIPEGAIETMTVQSGSNPAFGLNSLGGALAIQTKTGFSAPKHELEVSGGSWGRHSEEITSGWNNGTFGYFIDTKFFGEDGWRDFSDSEVKQAMGTFSWRGSRSDLDLTLATADNALRGNGTLPVELMQVNRSAVFTHPDITRNRLFFSSLTGNHDLTEEIQLSGNMYYRRNNIRTYNGDGSEFGECAANGNEYLCDEEDELLEDLNEQLIPYSDRVEGGTINTSEAKQQAFGFSLQTAFNQTILKHDNHLVVGWAYDYGSVHFQSDSEVGQLTDDRGVNGSGILLEDSHVRLNTTTETNGAFFSDTFTLTEQLNLTFAGRYNTSDIKLMDQYGTSLNGQHHYDRFNPSAGLTYAFHPEVTVYGNYSESTRMPTPMELSCADPEDPCKLPNAFVSDPPLKQVVAETFEAGFRGKTLRIPETSLTWNLGLFQTVSNNDIIFQSTGGVIANTGYFANVGRTRRQGIELGLNADVLERLHLSTHYTFLDARFRTAYLSHSPNHPDADANGDIQVKHGDRIPGIPEHLLKFSADYDIFPEWTFGMNMLFNGEQFLRGDEANLATPLASYMLFNLKTEYRINKHVALFGKVDNLFDHRYSNFGTFGNTGDVLEDTLGVDDLATRFVGVGAPRAGWVGIRFTL